MTVPFVDLREQYASIKDEINNAIHTVLNEATFVGGSHVKNFESDFGTQYGVRNVIGVGNGTDAIYIVLKMLGIGPGDEVITTAASWISTSETISQTGAKPVFVDIDPNTYTIDVRLIEKKITSRTKAILPVHLYGHIAEVSKLKKICEQQNLFLVEDCAQSHFSSELDVLAGKSGIAGTFSFYPGKNLGAYGDAGCIITNDDKFADRCRMFANHGSLQKHDHQMEGINSRLDSLQAAILNVKLRYISVWTQARINNAIHYQDLLKDVTQITLPVVREKTRHTFHLFVIRTQKRDELKKYLESRGVQTAIHYPTALPNLPAYKYLGLSPGEFPVASQYQSQILSLPMYPELTRTQIEFVCNEIKQFYRDL
jgi:dTDP-4-amino-4,6-dideoxygalactose transaminase